MTDIRPLDNRVVMEQLPPEDKIGNIFIPDTAKEKSLRGRILVCGHGLVNKDGQRLPMEVKQGDVVIYRKYAGQEIKHEGKEYLLVKETDIEAILEPKENADSQN